MRKICSENVRIKKTPKVTILFQSIVSLLFFVLSVVAPSTRLCAAADEVVYPFDVYAADGSGEQLLHITVQPNGHRVQVMQKGVVAMPGKPHGISRHPTQSVFIVTLLGQGAESPRAVTLRTQ